MIDKKMVEEVKEFSESDFCSSLVTLSEVIVKYSDIDTITVRYRTTDHAPCLKIKISADRSNNTIALAGVNDRSDKLLGAKFEQIKKEWDVGDQGLVRMLEALYQDWKDGE